MRAMNQAFEAYFEVLSGFTEPLSYVNILDEVRTTTDSCSNTIPSRATPMRSELHAMRTSGCSQC